MHQEKFQRTRAGGSQCSRILDHLSERAGQWVPMPELVRVGGGYAVHSRISDLNARRRANGLPEIENDSHHRLDDGTVVSCYRLPLAPVNPPSNPPPTTTDAMMTAAQNPPVASNSPMPGGIPASGLEQADLFGAPLRPGREMFA